MCVSFVWVWCDALIRLILLCELPCFKLFFFFSKLRFHIFFSFFANGPSSTVFYCFAEGDVPQVSVLFCRGWHVTSFCTVLQRVACHKFRVLFCRGWHDTSFCTVLQRVPCQKFLYCSGVGAMKKVSVLFCRGGYVKIF